MESSGTKIQLLDKIGEGTYGKVWVGRYQNPEIGSRLAAIKLETYDRTENSLFKEFQVMKKIGKQQNVIEYLEYADNVKQVVSSEHYHENIEELKELHPYYLALEFAENRSLLSYLNRKSTGEILEEKWVRLYFRQILNGMIAIRSKGLCHLDIKVDNILIDGNLNAKIGDFGFA